MAKKLILLVLCIALTGCAESAKKHESISQIKWPIPADWVELFGDGPESQRDWNIRLLGQYMQRVDKKFQELDKGTPKLADPNLPPK